MVSALSELDAAHKALKSFSHSVSHDLRAPLRSIASLIEMLDEEHGERLGTDGRNVLGVVREGCRNLDQMLAAVTAFAQAVSQPLEAVPIDMTALAHEAVQTSMNTIGPEPVVDVQTLPPTVGDPTALRLVWYHLVGNALKFSSKRAQPKVAVSAISAAHETIYQVKDNGVGFDMRYGYRLFGVFQRLHRADEFTGSGVGLAVVQRLLERQGGRIWFDASHDRGATFYFALPRLTD